MWGISYDLGILSYDLGNDNIEITVFNSFTIVACLSVAAETRLLTVA
jgi:hypothetical protein